MSNLFTFITFAKDFYKNNSISVLYNYSNAGFEKKKMAKTMKFHFLDFLKSLGHFLSKNRNMLEHTQFFKNYISG